MNWIEIVSTALLLVGAVASGLFFIFYMRFANLRSAVARQILALNGGIAGVLILSLMRRFDLYNSSVSLYLSMGLFTFINIALIYQFRMLWVARRGYRRQHKESKEEV